METTQESRRRPTLIAVIGSGSPNADAEQQAEAVGREIALAGAWLVCGGLGGVMEAAARGAKSAGGLTIGLLPGESKHSANQWIDIILPTGMGEARNLLIVRAADAVIALPGAYGTMSEIVFALLLGKPVVSQAAEWSFDPAIRHSADPKAAVALALHLSDGAKA